MWFIILFTLLVAFYAYVKWRFTYWSRRGVPNPEPTFLLGNIGPTLTLAEHVGALTGRWYNDFQNAPYVGYYKFLEPAIVLRDPDLIKDIMIKDCSSFHANDFHLVPKYDPLMATNPFLSVGETWKRGRNILVPMFSAVKIKSIFPLMEFATNNFRNYVKNQPIDKDYDAKSLCAKFTTENVFKCSFSFETGCFEPGKNEFREIGKRIFAPSLAAAFRFLISPILPKSLFNIIPIPLIPTDVDAWFRNLIKKNRESRKNVQLQNEDFMQMLFNSEDKFGTDDTEIAGHTVTLFIEGFETSSTTLAFTFYELAMSAQWQERLRTEINEVLEKHDNKFTYEALQEMTLVDCAVQEALRMHPVMLQMQKLCTEEYTLPKFGSQKEGVKIYPGTTVIIPVQSIHSDPSLYPDPEVFNPDRFSEDERKRRHKAHYMPFGEGPRMCMGWRFGMTQVKAAVVTIIRDFHVSLSPNHKPFQLDSQSFLKQAKDGLLLNIAPLNQNEL